jgi:hypothetical protein
MFGVLYITLNLKVETFNLDQIENRMPKYCEESFKTIYIDAGKFFSIHKKVI